MTEIEKQEIEKMAEVIKNTLVVLPSESELIAHGFCMPTQQDKGAYKLRIFDREDYIRKQLATALFKAGYRKIDGDTSDGYHTYNELYHHRAVLFTMICNQNKEIAWKSKKHSDGTMFDNMFIVGIETPVGQATYHYDIEPYWDYFNVKELDNAPLWDGHTAEQAIERIRLMADDAPIVCTKAEVVKEFAEMLKSETKGLTTVIKEIDKIAAEFGVEEDK